MSDTFAEFDATIDSDAWEYLNDNYPALADTVRKAVERGATPEQLRTRWLRRAGEHRIELARRVENAARHLAQGRVKV